ncbi:phosphoribosyl-AMP cyclohydrolase [Lamprobacter modestohalophilus]|uniref:Phosphoribosyl-AMP cyclohydrolase n=1 Tax=Lamprobacter modestohalophilus TaxID=1064514 RepID=A0A9X1B5E2_9GAMM|nr:phosphoribosyl-AMP cyclohydrolase [Lamprobacter modestohalophilus]
MKNIVDFSKGNGLVTAIVQDAETGEILMVANMNEESLAKTIELGEAVYWSRSRKKLWHKGEESGHTQKIRGLYLDCDGDALLLKVEQIGGAACHTGKRSCFFRKLDQDSVTDVGVQVFDPGEVYKK